MDKLAGIPSRVFAGPARRFAPDQRARPAELGRRRLGAVETDGGPQYASVVRARTSQFLREYASTSLEQEDILVRLAALERTEDTSAAKS
jgi:hypothetical protein